jgi:oligosaccharide repeat unit polymerase|tara:strand:- start:4582 stop:5913 length:1332 start_codon:yes stop_codon:yes gene_type:complete
MLFCLVAFFFPSYKIFSFIAVFGGFIFLYILYKYLVNFVLHKKNISITVFLFSSFFWFWKEFFVLGLTPILYENTASYSPFYGRQIPLTILAKSALMICMFNYLVIFLYSIVPRNTYNFIVTKRNISNKNTYVDLVLFFVSTSGWFFLRGVHGSFQSAILGLLDFRTHVVEIEEGFLKYLPIFSIVASSFAIFRLSSGAKGNKLLKLTTFILGGTIAVLSGTRFKLIFLLLPFILGIMLFTNDRFNLKFKIYILSITTFLLLGLSFFQVFNRYGEGSRSAVDKSISSSTIGSDHFSALSHAVYLGDNLQSYFKQPSIFIFLTDLIPRFIWPEKPESLFWDYYNSKIAVGGNVTPSLLGQYYLNWGILGVFLISINFALFLSFAEYMVSYYKKYSNSYYLYISCLLLTFLFLSFRVYSLNYFFYVLVGILFCFLFTKKGNAIEK